LLHVLFGNNVEDILEALEEARAAELQIGGDSAASNMQEFMVQFAKDAEAAGMVPAGFTETFFSEDGH
jgi:hypothetical protein